jgi:alpha-glucosidase
VSVYQGEELGLPEADVPFERLQDPYGITFWPNFKGRDGCRTPMPWSGSDHAGFSTGTAWLPIAPEHLALSVSNQEDDPDAPLHAFRRLLRWRGEQSVLRGGEIDSVKATAEVLSFQRYTGTKRIAAAFNLSNRSATVQLGELRGARVLTGHGLPSGSLIDDTLTLPPHGVFFGEL